MEHSTHESEGRLVAPRTVALQGVLHSALAVAGLAQPVLRPQDQAPVRVARHHWERGPNNGLVAQPHLVHLKVLGEALYTPADARHVAAHKL